MMTSYPAPIEYTFRDWNDVRGLKLAARLTGEDAFADMAALGDFDILAAPPNGVCVTVPAEMRRCIVACREVKLGEAMDLIAADQGLLLLHADIDTFRSIQETAAAFVSAVLSIRLLLTPDLYE